MIACHAVASFSSKRSASSERTMSPFECCAWSLGSSHRESFFFLRWDASLVAVIAMFATMSMSSLCWHYFDSCLGHASPIVADAAPDVHDAGISICKAAREKN